MAQKSEEKTPGMCKSHVNNGINWINYHINWLAGFLNHQQYDQGCDPPFLGFQLWNLLRFAVLWRSWIRFQSFREIVGHYVFFDIVERQSWGGMDFLGLP